MIELPDERGGWIPSATSAALRAAGTNGCDLVIASGPPFAALVVAHRVAERLKIPWIADYRDLWSNGSYYSRSEARAKSWTPTLNGGYFQIARQRSPFLYLLPTTCDVTFLYQ